MEEKKRTPTSTAELFDALEIEQLGNLYLIARTLVDGLYQGRHPTPERGGSTEFFDYRMYTSGESLTRVDWKVFARTDRLYLRRYQHFGNLTLHLMVDGSASMAFAQPNPSPSSGAPFTKFSFATILAAALGVLAVRQSEHVALGIAGERLEHATPPGGTWTHLYRIIHALEDHEPAGKTAIGTALSQSQQLIPRRRLIYILSDGLENTARILEAVHRLCFHGNDVVFIQILTPAEVDLTGVDAERFIDSEFPELDTRTNVNEIRTEYTQLMGRQVDRLRKGLEACGAEHVLVSTTEHPLHALRRALWQRQRFAADVSSVSV